MNITNVLLDDILKGKRAVVELSNDQCRQVLLLLIGRVKKENRR